MSQDELLKVKGIGKTTADKLVAQGINTIEELVNTPLGTMMAATGFGEIRSGLVRDAAAELTVKPKEPTAAPGLSLEDPATEAAEAPEKPEAKKKKKKKKKKGKGKADRKKSKKKSKTKGKKRKANKKNKKKKNKGKKK